MTFLTNEEYADAIEAGVFAPDTATNENWNEDDQ